MQLTDEQLAKLNNITDIVPSHKSPPRDAAATSDLPRRPDPLGALGMAEHDPESPFPYSRPQACGDWFLSCKLPLR